jgi:rSAM/selenodomain-associated transferase 1
VRSVLGLFAKQPVAGQVKTRMSPPLSPDQAAALYEAMLLDIIGQHSAKAGFEVALWCAPPEASGWFATRVPAHFRVLPQRGSGLGERLAHAMRLHAEQGFERIVIRGTDSPTLPPERIGEAFAALEDADLVLCPDRDGGYNLVGLREPSDGLFQIELGTSSVLEDTLARARQLGLRARLLPAHCDVDRIADLEEIAPALTLERTPRTRAWVERRR